VLSLRIYVNHAARVSFFAKLLIQRHYGVIMFLANKPFFSLANGMELGGIGLRALLKISFSILILSKSQSLLTTLWKINAKYVNIFKINNTCIKNLSI